jgi:hypothetical protein
MALVDKNSSMLAYGYDDNGHCRGVFFLYIFFNSNHRGEVL